MFCPYCGTKVVDDAAFCMSCGRKIVSEQGVSGSSLPMQNPAEIQVQQYQIQKNAMRRSEIDSLTTAIAHFSQKANQFDEYDDVCDGLNYYARGARSSLLVWGCIIVTLSLFCLLAAQELAILLVLTIPGAMMIVGGILMKVNNRKQYRYYGERYAQLSNELYTHYLMCPNCPVGPEYANPEILKIFLGVLQSGRADTVKESINIAIDERHQAEVSAYLEEIKWNAAQINAQTQVAAFFAAANFFS